MGTHKANAILSDGTIIAETEELEHGAPVGSPSALPRNATVNSTAPFPAEAALRYLRVWRIEYSRVGRVIIPARVRKPKDKPNAERTVGIISTWIIASLRNRQFFSLSELNQAISRKLEQFNSRPFQKKVGSMVSVFLEGE